MSDNFDNWLERGEHLGYSPFHSTITHCANMTSGKNESRNPIQVMQWRSQIF